MKAIILAAGRGSRLGNLTDQCPKCLVRISGLSLLERQISALRSAGIDDITIVTGYQAEQIEAHHSATRHNALWQNTNMVFSLLCARDVINQPVVVSYSDILYAPETVRALMETNADLAISYDPDWLTLWTARFDDPLDDAETFDIAPDGRVTEIGGRPRHVSQIKGQYMGLLRIAPAVLQWIDNLALDAGGDDLLRRMDMTTLLSRLIDSGKPVIGVANAGYWCEIDDAHDLEVAMGVLRAYGIA